MKRKREEGREGSESGRGDTEMQELTRCGGAGRGGGKGGR